ncbi:hypothetical protein Pelo_2188 [Pelomyxa schiedti]|nr:hypothetical protein Pelo_2188 [Pelomyxa schiedti]
MLSTSFDSSYLRLPQSKQVVPPKVTSQEMCAAPSSTPSPPQTTTTTSTSQTTSSSPPALSPSMDNNNSCATVTPSNDVQTAASHAIDLSHLRTSGCVLANPQAAEGSSRHPPSSDKDEVASSLMSKITSSGNVEMNAAWVAIGRRGENHIAVVAPSLPHQISMKAAPNEHEAPVLSISRQQQLMWTTLHSSTRSSVWMLNGSVVSMICEKESEMDPKTIDQKQETDTGRKSNCAENSVVNVQQDDSNNTSSCNQSESTLNTSQRRIVIAESTRQLHHHLISSSVALHHGRFGNHSSTTPLLDTTTKEGAMKAALNLSAYIEKHVNNEFLYSVPDTLPDVSTVKQQAASIHILMRALPPLHTACYAFLDLITDFPGLLITKPFTSFLDTHIPCAFKSEVLFGLLDSDSVAFWKVIQQHIRFCVQHGRDILTIASTFSGRLIQVAPPSWSYMQEFKFYTKLVEYLERPADSLSLRALERVIVEDETFVFTKELYAHCEKQELPSIMRSILRIYAHHNMCIPLFQNILCDAVDKSNSLNDVLRPSSLAAILFQALVYIYAKEYIVQTLKPAVILISQNAEAFDMKLAKSNSKHRRIEVRQLTVLKTAQRTFEHILNSCNFCPIIIRQVFRLLQDIIIRKYNPTLSLMHQFIGGKLLQYVYCLPLKEGLHNIFSPQVSPVDQVPLEKVLTTIADVLPLIASGEEPFNPELGFLVQWIQSKASSLYSFTDFFVDVTLSSNKTPPSHSDLFLDLTLLNNQINLQPEIVEELPRQYIQASAKLRDFLEVLAVENCEM